MLADASDCDLVELGHSCEDDIVVYPVPGYRDPDDPCWKLGVIEAVANASAGPALVANLDAWMGLIAATDLRPRGIHHSGYEIDWTPREAIVDALLDAVPAARIIPTLVLHIGLESTPTPLDAIAQLEALPSAEVEAIARSLLDDLRPDHTRCEEVSALVEVLDALDIDQPCCPRRCAGTRARAGGCTSTPRARRSTMAWSVRHGRRSARCGPSTSPDRILTVMGRDDGETEGARGDPQLPSRVQREPDDESSTDTALARASAPRPCRAVRARRKGASVPPCSKP